MANKLAWFLTDAGKRFSFYAACAVSTSTALVHFAPHTFFLDTYEEFLHLYKNGMAVQLTDKLKQRFQKTLDILEVKKADQHLYKPFFAYGFDIISAGSAYSKFGAIIGLPYYFTHESTSDIDKSKIKLSDETIIWDKEEAQQLLDSLVMSENGQLYAMAKEILYRQSPKPLLDMCFATMSIIGLYGTSRHLNTKFDLYSRPIQLRLAMYYFVAMFMYGVYIMSKDTTQIFAEERIDKKLKQIDPRFAEGGAEYYRKVLQRNIALRTLMGSEGERRFSITGNENTFLRTRNLPLVHRKSIFDETQ
ncbi:unnamed protein product [Acanthoscelides obtectus]|uniref:Transmembrane protein 177 n=2 Tax=Acanthoscelides obtectus TaxID=200917 RepID=A0A9P0PGN4_ACAOB|nr:unnamed protein product [Acanthoscelides obtectus]CAH1985442.1 unnamed protein product [Acanthoscelides obtectus]CAK1625502.1 Transmembrane protein 177 [Acanthoscelides obtectus]CAK1625538.1 Transmembrane protein 177 [Acanthoscelides obtectus]